MTRSSNFTSLSYAEESSLKVLPGTPIWYGLEPNSYSSFGSSLSTVARSPIDPSRQNKKGTITDLEANAGFEIDFTRTNLNRLLQGFLFADADEFPSTQPLVGTAVPITSTTATTYVAASGLTPFNKAGMLIYGRGFGNPTNNGLKVVTSATGTAITTTGLAIEASPPAAAMVECVGQEYPAADLSVTYSGGIATLVSASSAHNTSLQAGSWIYIGGDAVANKFATFANGWARIRSVSASQIVLDDCMLAGGAAPVADAGTGKSIRIFFGAVIKNQFASADIKRRTYTFERQLGMGTVGQMAEYVLGAVPNEFTLNIPGQDKITAELSFVACDVDYASGESGDLILSGTRIAALGEDAYNTSADVKMTKLAILPTGSQASPLFAYATEVSLAINNNASPSKAVGILGALDVNVGNIEATGSITAYFENTAALSAVRNNADISYTVANVCGGKNYGFLFDVPLLQLSTEGLNVEKDSDILVPLEVMGAQSKFGHTVLYQMFPYLPDAASL